MTSGQIRSKIERELNVGDSAIEIETFFKRSGLEYSFNKYRKPNNNYSAILRTGKSNYHAITIRIYVDEKKKFLYAEVRDSYTFL